MTTTQIVPLRPRKRADYVDGIHLDFETYSMLDVRQVGSYAYARHWSTEVLILGYQLPGWDYRKFWLPMWRTTVPLPDDLVDLCTVGDAIPADLRRAIEKTDAKTIAHNAEFEMEIWAHKVVRCHAGPEIPLKRWRCTAARAAAAGLPRSLEKLGAALMLHTQKDKDGTRLINIFSKPRKPTKLNASTRTYPWDKPDEFFKFIRYCGTDVETEAEADLYVPDLPPSEWKAYAHTVTMNRRGLPLDMRAVENGYQLLKHFEGVVSKRFTELSGGIRPTQRDKVLAYFNTLGVEIENMQAKTIRDLILAQGADLDETALELLQLRIEGGKASTKKLAKMLQVVCADGAVRGGFLFYGASTGRLSGKYIQPHNFMRGEFTARGQNMLFEFIIAMDIAMITLMFRWPIDALGQGMRGYIHARPGKKLVVVDFAAIEARVLAWLARQMDIVELYNQNADLYKKFAVLIYHLDSEEDVTPAQRKFAKDLYLGAGYQLGKVGFISNALKRGILVSEEEAGRAINTYRKRMPKVVNLWYDVEDAAIRAVQTCASSTNPVQLRNLSFFVDGIWFCIKLPSGRLLRYPYPKVEKAVRFGKPVDKLTYRSEIKGKWVREGTYGGKLIENIVQAISRDLMMNACYTAEPAGYPVIGTVHDELITEVDKDFGSPHELEELVCQKPAWAAGAPIGAEGWEQPRYRK